MTLTELFPNSNNNHFGSTFEVLEIPTPKRTTSKFKLLCTVCDCEVEMKPVKVFAGQRACKCSTMYYKNPTRRFERLVTTLKAKDISLLSESIEKDIRWHTMLDLSCNICSNKWTTQENNVVNYNTGCGRCAGVQKLTIDEIEARFKNLIGNSKISSFKLLGENWKDPILVTCVCGFERTAQASQIYQDPSSCPKCAVSGFKPHEPATLYLLELKNNEDKVIGYKYGITGNLEERHRKIQRGFIGKVSLWSFWEYPTGSLAQTHELTFKRAFNSLFAPSEMKDGWTETFSPELFNCFLTLQKAQYLSETY